jgi:hypothetical protein
MVPLSSAGLGGAGGSLSSCWSLGSEPSFSSFSSFLSSPASSFGAGFADVAWKVVEMSYAEGRGAVK